MISTKHSPGDILGRLRLIMRLPKKGWLVECSCGTRKIVKFSGLRGTRSCGCLRRELASNNHLRKHGCCKTVEYGTYRAMLSRCRNKNSKEYHRYGGRGIRVCDSWKSSFTEFLADMGLKPDGCNTIERIDVDGDYCSDNCLWVPRVCNKPDSRLGVDTVPGSIKRTSHERQRLHELQREQRRTNGARTPNESSR